MLNSSNWDGSFSCIHRCLSSSSMLLECLCQTQKFGQKMEYRNVSVHCCSVDLSMRNCFRILIIMSQSSYFKKLKWIFWKNAEWVKASSRINQQCLCLHRIISSSLLTEIIGHFQQQTSTIFNVKNEKRQTLFTCIT